MKYLILLYAMLLMSFGVSADTGTNTSTNNYVENTNAPTFVAPLTMGGGDVLPSYTTVTTTSATCPSNQLILDAVNTTSRLRGSGAPRIGNYGYAFGARVVIPFGDGGNCIARGKAISRDAKLISAHNEAASTHNLCWKVADDLARRKVFADGNYYDEYPGLRKCRKILTMAKVSYLQPAITK